MANLKPGDWCELINPGPHDPLRMELRPRGIVSRVGADGVMISHELPGEGVYGPFPAERVRRYNPVRLSD